MASMRASVSTRAGATRGGAVVARASKEAIVKAKEVPGRKKTGVYFASEQSLSYLDGTLPGDFAFDPLGLSDPEGSGGVVNPEWLSYCEVIHARFAMLGAAVRPAAGLLRSPIPPPRERPRLATRQWRVDGGSAPP